MAAAAAVVQTSGRPDTSGRGALPPPTPPPSRTRHPASALPSPADASAAGASIHEGRPARALLAATLMGWRYGWSDGSLARALATLAIQVRIDQWPALLAAAQHADAAEAVTQAVSSAGWRW